MIYKSACMKDQYFILGVARMYTNKKRIEADFTYNEGKFYPDGFEPIDKFDLHPIVEGCQQADIRQLPIADETYRTAVIDLPYMIKTGEGFTDKDRFGKFDSWEECFHTHEMAAKEAFRVLKPLGYLFWKSQDQVSSGTFNDLTGRVYRYALEAGFNVVDRAYRIHKDSRPNPNQTSENQAHFRQNVNVWLVLQKPYST